MAQWPPPRHRYTPYAGVTQVNLDKLEKNYSGATSLAVDNLSLQIDSGELLALLGPSGCGKTTTLKMIAGLLAPNSGDIRFDNESVLRLQPEQRQAAMVFQNHLLFAHMNVFDNVSFGLRMRHTPKTEIRKRVNDMMARVQLEGFAKRQPHELSGGQQQRVALARALVTQPRLMLLDEPLSSLDTDLRTDMRKLIRELQRETGITTIMVTHDQGDAMAIADKIAFMMNGKLKQYSDTAGFINSPIDEETARFFGGENFIPGKVVGNHFKCDFGEMKLTNELSANASGASKITIRAENIAVIGVEKHSVEKAGVENPAPTAADNSIVVTLTAAEAIGNYWRLSVRPASVKDVQPIELTIVCHQRELSDSTPGKQLRIRLPEEYLWTL